MAHASCMHVTCTSCMHGTCIIYACHMIHLCMSLIHVCMLHASYMHVTCRSHMRVTCIIYAWHMHHISMAHADHRCMSHASCIHVTCRSYMHVTCIIYACHMHDVCMLHAGCVCACALLFFRILKICFGRSCYHNILRGWDDGERGEGGLSGTGALVAFCWRRVCACGDTYGSILECC